MGTGLYGISQINATPYHHENTILVALITLAKTITITITMTTSITKAVMHQSL